MDEFIIRARGYDTQREASAGSFVQAIRPVAWSVRRVGSSGLTSDSYDRGTLQPGDVVEVVSYTNAGFRGIECTVRLPDGRLAHGLQAGCFALA